MVVVEYLVQSGLQVGRRGQSPAQAHSGLRRAKPDFVDRRPSWPKEWQPHPEAKGVRFGARRRRSACGGIAMSPLATARFAKGGRRQLSELAPIDLGETPEMGEAV